MAERVGFEPTVELPRQQFSRLPDSAALAPLRYDGSSTVNREQVGCRLNEFGQSLPWPIVFCNA
jgi:hypothetical protein